MGRCAIRRGPGAAAASAWPLQHSSAECRPRLYWEERARRCPSVVCFAFRVCPVQTRFLLAHRPSPPRRRARICHPVAQRYILPPLLHYCMITSRAHGSSIPLPDGRRRLAHFACAVPSLGPSSLRTTPQERGFDDAGAELDDREKMRSCRIAAHATGKPRESLRRPEEAFSITPLCHCAGLNAPSMLMAHIPRRRTCASVAQAESRAWAPCAYGHCPTPVRATEQRARLLQRSEKAAA